jgi:hypothetical protein
MIVAINIGEKDMLHKIISIIFLSWIIIGCSSHKVVLPNMDLPPEPQKPAIKSSVIVQNSIPYIGYTIPDAMKLYEYLLNKDAYEYKLKYRIDSMNKLWSK